jgi:hypothetical protein
METSTSTQIEQFLKPKAVSSRKLARDAEGRLMMAEESALDMDRIRDAGITVSELGRRVRVYNGDMTKQLAAYIVPIEVASMRGDDAERAVGAKIQVGRLLSEDGLYLRHNPGVREIGVNDRGDVILRLDAEAVEELLQHHAGGPDFAAGRAHRQEEPRSGRQGSARLARGDERPQRWQDSTDPVLQRRCLL